MFNKSLVSIYFLEDTLLIAELDAKRENVVKWAKVSLPPGLIENYKVKDPKKLSGVLKKTLDDEGITEKSVGLVIPEFSTFSKLVSLPKLPPSELHEAVLWQAGEYLPEGIENMIIDWKIVKRDEGKMDVLMVAVSKEILLGYVEVCEVAGLFPHGVQTPSVCLTNLISEDNEPELLIYSGFGESVLILTTGEKITGTSVLATADSKEIIETATKMLSHYQGNKVSKVFICGSGITDSIVGDIKSNLKIETLPLPVKIKGIDPVKVQELIIPISMLTKDVDEPSNVKTVNLLPPSLMGKYRFRKNKIQIWTLTLTITLFTWFCFLIVLGSYLVAVQQITSLKEKNRVYSDTFSRIQKYETDAKKINTTALKVLKIKSEYITPQEVLNAVSAAKPESIYINEYKMDFDKGIMEIIGKSEDRESLLAFKSSLESIPKVSNVSIPISNFEAVSNLDFSMSFNYDAN